MPLLEIFYSRTTTDLAPARTDGLVTDLALEFIKNHGVKQNLAGQPVQTVIHRANPLPKQAHFCIRVSGIPDGCLGRPARGSLEESFRAVVARHFPHATFQLSILKQC